MGSLVPRPSSHWLAAMTLMIPPRGAVDTRPLAGSGRGAGRKVLVGWAHMGSKRSTRGALVAWVQMGSRVQHLRTWMCTQSFQAQKVLRPVSPTHRCVVKQRRCYRVRRLRETRRYIERFAVRAGGLERVRSVGKTVGMVQRKP